MDFYLSSTVETYAAAVIVTSPVSPISKSGIIAQASLHGSINDGGMIDMDIIGTVIDGDAIDTSIAGTIIDGAYNPELHLIGDASTTGDISLVGDVTTHVAGSAVNLSLLSDTNTEGDVSISLVSVGTIFSAMPFYAEKLVVVEGDTNEITLESLVFQDGGTDIHGTIIEVDEAESVDFISPLNIFAGAIVENFNIPGDVTTLDYNANVTLAAYSALLTVPFQQTNEVIVGEETTLSLLASIENLNFMLTTDIADSGSIRYEVADIDRGLQEGRLRIFPNEWTLSYINNPVDASGNMNTVSSFIIPLLEDTYGSSIFEKISLITARNPVTGVLYNYVIQDGYRTPDGTVNDFDLCYKIDNVFYPVPFMVKSITNDELEIFWALGQEE